ncbi:type II secretion system secretin GspD [bacterium]|jgi:general secretion pathway protein D|nr:type II secretion system secretin GspD [bacterium]
MRLNKIIVSFFITIFLSINVFANEQINMNFKDLEIKEFAKIVSKILDKNILFTVAIKGKVDFESNKPVYTDDLLNILIYVLESKGYTVLDNEGILRIIRLSDAAKYNTPVYNNAKNITTYQMVTEVFNIEHSNVDYVSSKVRHLISKSAKLVTDKESNAIVLTDFPSNIKTVKQVISMVARDAKKSIEIVELKNLQGSVILADLKNVAKTIFNEKIEKEKVEVLLNKDTNAIMFVGKKKNVDYLVNYLKGIDEKGSLVEKSVEVVYLKNAESKSVIKILNGVIGQKIYKDKNDKPFASTDDESNSIILMGPKDEIKYFVKLIEKLDVDRAQVYVKARIIEVSEKKTRDVGIKYGIDGFSANSGGLTTFTSALNDGASSISQIATMGGLDLSTMSNAFALGMTINLLNQNGAIDIVSEPSLLCINNQESSIYVGETISIKTGTTTSSYGPTDTYKREDVGLTLKVKPRISNSNKVLLELSTKLEDVGQTDTSSGNANTTKKDLLTTAIVNNGESIILGGYIREKIENTVHKLPLLGDMPLLGSLFRNKNEVKDKINLVIIITPYIIPKSKDLAQVRNELSQLKLLEEKYTKDTILRLEKASLRAREEDQKRDEEKQELYDEFSDN